MGAADQERLDGALRYRLAFEDLIAATSTRFINVASHEIDAAVNGVLAEIGRFAGVDRAYVILHNPDGLTLANTHEWCSEGVASQQDELQEIPRAAMPMAMSCIEGEGILYVPEVAGLPSEWANEKAVFESGGIKSLVCVAMPVSGRVIGLAGFDAVRSKRLYDAQDLRLLRLVGEMLAGALERKRLESERHELAERLAQAQKLEAIGRLAGGVAHDFNNLLSAILGLADLALLEVEEASSVARDLQDIRSAAERAAGLTQQLLAFSRRQNLEVQSLDLNAEVRRMSSVLRRLVRADVEIQIDLDPEIGHVRADRTQITQILVNLVSNAADAVRIGGNLQIGTRVARFAAGDGRRPPELAPGDYVELAVHDDGQGIDPELARRIFEPFFTTKDHGRGTGLGLATVYGIVKQHLGHIEVESGLGEGTTFHIYLPRANEGPGRDVVSGGKEDGSARGETNAPVATEAVVLVAEDETFVRELICRILKTEGFAVLTAANGEQALEVARGQSGKIDLLLTDVVMPKMNGRELAAKLQIERPGIKVLYTSGYTDELITAQGMLPPGFHLLRKPFSPEELRRRVAAELESE